MKSILPLCTLLLFFASCTTAYKSGQTPDDVYFSPPRPQQAREEYVQVEEEDDRSYRRAETPAYSYEDDRYLRMKIRNRNQWSYLEDYYRDPYAYNYSNRYYYNQYGYSNPRAYWNNYYNPYSPHVVVVNPRVNRPRSYNLHVFDNPQNTNTPKASTSRSTNYKTGTERNAPAQRNEGSDLRSIFRNSDNNSGTRPSATPSTPPAGSSSESGGGTAPKRRS
ncbi:MAG: hypothetical protein WKF70_08990 [Chitinophagaceae bacterium]